MFAQAALAWLPAQGDTVIPVFGTRSVSVLEENMGLLNVTLTDEEAAQLDRTFPAGVAAGDRYGPVAMKGVNL